MSLAPADAVRLEECLAGDGVAVIPTDTVYGLACNPRSEVAVRRIYELKRRPPFKPAAVMFFALEPVLGLVDGLGPHTRAALTALLPGPLTLLLPNPAGLYPLAGNPIPGESTSDEPALGGSGQSDPVGGAASCKGAPLLGLRVPELAGPLAVLTAVRLPALQSSANFSGEPDPRSLSDVPAALCEGADLVLDGGDLPGTASTVLDLGGYEGMGEWRIMRAGPVGAGEIAGVLS
jgi:L-threonylcarbamoyladenylate synthase